MADVNVQLKKPKNFDAKAIANKTFVNGPATATKPISRLG